MYVNTKYLNFKIIILNILDYIKKQFIFVFFICFFKVLVNVSLFKAFKINELVTKLSTSEFFSKFDNPKFLEFLYKNFYYCYNFNSNEWIPYRVRWVKPNRNKYINFFDFYNKYTQALHEIDMSYSVNSCLLLNFIYIEEYSLISYIYFPFEFYFILFNLVFLVDNVRAMVGYKNLQIFKIFLFFGPKNNRDKKTAYYLTTSYVGFDQFFLDNYALHNYMYLWFRQKRLGYTYV